MTLTHPLIQRFGHQRRWCNWYYGKPNKKGKRGKIPTAHGKAVDATHPHEGLLTFAEAKRADAKHIGIALGECEGEWLNGFDRDNCIAKGKPSPDAQAFAELAQTLDDISPSGKGVHWFIVTRAEIPTRTDKVAGYEFYGAGRFFTFTGKPISEARDIRSVSKAKALALVNAFFPAEIAKPKTIARPSVSVIEPPSSNDELADALSFVADWRADDRHEWIRVGMAIKAARGDAGRELWRAFSMRSSKFDAKQFNRDWQSLKPSRIGIGTLYRMAREDGGWRPPSSARNQTRAQIVAAMQGLRSIELPDTLPVRDERTDTGTLNGEPIAEHRKAINVSRGTVFAVADAMLAYAHALGHTKGLALSMRRIADLASVDKKQAWAGFVAMRRLGWLKQSGGYVRPRDMDKSVAFDLTLEGLAKRGTEGDISIQDYLGVAAPIQYPVLDMSPSVPLPHGRMRVLAARGLWSFLGPTARRICECLEYGEHTHSQLIALTRYGKRTVTKALARLAEFMLIESGRDGWALVYDFDLRANAVCDELHGKAKRTPAQRATTRRNRHAAESKAFKQTMDVWRVERALADEPDAGVDAMDGDAIDAAILAIDRRKFKRENRARDWRAGVEASTLKREAIEGWRKVHAEQKQKRGRS